MRVPTHQVAQGTARAELPPKGVASMRTRFAGDLDKGIHGGAAVGEVRRKPTIPSLPMQLLRRILGRSEFRVCTLACRRLTADHLGSGVMIGGAGPRLDILVARRLGKRGPQVQPYSIDSNAADRLVDLLETHRISASFESLEGHWYCTLWTSIAGARERLATGSGKTRPLALCLAVVNLPGEKVQPREP